MRGMGNVVAAAEFVTLALRRAASKISRSVGPRDGDSCPARALPVKKASACFLNRRVLPRPLGPLDLPRIKSGVAGDDRVGVIGKSFGAPRSLSGIGGAQKSQGSRSAKTMTATRIGRSTRFGLRK